MDYSYITIERPSERIAVVRFDRKDRANALSMRAMAELTHAAGELDADAELSAVVLTGSDRNFSLGADLKDSGNANDGSGLNARRMALRAGPRMCEAWERLEPMTIAAVEGYCVGGGAALVVSCDLRILANDSTVYVPEIERGMNMSWGSVPRIVNLVGPARAKRIIVLAEKLDAARCERWGLADELSAPGQAVKKALELARRIAELPPVQVRMCKQGCDVAAKALNFATSYMDRDQFALAQTSDDFQEGVRAFLEKRPPRYTGR